LTFVAAALSVSTYVQPVAASLGMATRYWDCCMPSGAWHGKASVYKPVDVCEADGVTLIPSDKANQGKSGCDGGDQFACTCMQPFNDMKDETLGYGFSAFAAAGQQESDNECSCYEAHFNSKDADGKPLAVNKLIFQVINSGSDVHTDNFDFAIPGGGLGSFEQGCPNQWHNSVTSWGQQMGGVTSAQECKNIPESLQSGCSWRFKYWGNNPTLAKELKRVRCTKGLIDRSGCQRKDDAQQPVYSGITDAKGQPAPDQYKRDRSVC
ncbi:glycoside hydrolase, partial [Testicularia cyperi]